MGLWRAVAVKRQWDTWVKTTVSDPKERARLSKVKVFAYSAAYGVKPENPENLTGEKLDDISRRIEVRFAELDSQPDLTLDLSISS